MNSGLATEVPILTPSFPATNQMRTGYTDGVVVTRPKSVSSQRVVQHTMISDVSEIKMEAIQMYRKTVFGYMSFAIVGIVSSAVFFTLGVTFRIPFLAAAFGFVTTGLFAVGVYFDFKKWERKHV